MLRIGLDVGSTTLKCVALDEADRIIYKKYERHYSRITECAARMLSEAALELPGARRVLLGVSGSAGMGFSGELGLDFFQEVYATRRAVKALFPRTDVVIELGGEDAKILFLTGAAEVRMNGSCAGGTGAFIDQMATLLNIGADELNELAGRSGKIYSIASRCGVFAKSDIQPLLNQGAMREDICASILAAVVSQTIAGLAQGRPIEGNVIYLGGPLTFLSELRAAFDKNLGETGLCPENSLYFVAIGAAMLCAEGAGAGIDLLGITQRVSAYTASGGYSSCRPLFENEGQYEEFKSRHGEAVPPEADSLSGRVYLGVDAGSTTVKCVVTDEGGNIVFSRYTPSGGNPVPVVRGFLAEFYEKYPGVRFAAAASTGYGEEIIKNAFHLDLGVVETIAHFTAAKKFDPEVDFIIDIGGQDMKCFKIRGGAIDNIFLNEACSSGCGSFLQTFAGALGQSVAEFSQKGIFADRPVDLGSRCTVFMNSSVKQAQKDGASIENISAGLSISVVKNALYKVIRAPNADAVGRHIVVQGGTFLNDAVLRAFELELGREVTRPPISGLMGAYGAALFAKERAGKAELSAALGPEKLRAFTHEVRAVSCGGCQNHCRLTVNTFMDGGRFIGGNRCEKPLSTASRQEKYNLYDYTSGLLAGYESFKGERQTVGIPMGLNMFELYPFWHTFFKELGFGVTRSPDSNRALYLKGQSSIPSDTVCYPAKLLHGHYLSLAESGVDAVFYPCMSYNIDEGLSDNHFNCPVVAYYPEVLGANVHTSTPLIKDYLGLHRIREFPGRIQAVLEREFGKTPLPAVKRAVKAAMAEYRSFMARIRNKGMEFLELAREKKLPVIVLAGRPYHLDPEVNHGIDSLICDCGAVVISEIAVSSLTRRPQTSVLNQWTYHARLYAAAKFVAESKNPLMNLVQLVSFGCGVDAVTTDEVRSILEAENRIYTQIKIDEITNLGAVKIRLRSLFAATGM